MRARKNGYEEIQAALAAGRLKVEHDGTIFTRRLDPKAVWRKQATYIALGKNQKKGYPAVRMRCGFQAKSRNWLVHRVVWYALVGPIADGLEINHIDGDKFNNRLSNLELVTRKENLKHAVALGLFNPRAPKNRKLTREQVADIRARAHLGPVKLAAIHESNATTVSRILRGLLYVD